MSTFGFSFPASNQHTGDNVRCDPPVAWICANIINTEEGVGGDFRPLTCSRKPNVISQSGVTDYFFYP